MMTGTFAVSSGINLVMSYVSATVLQRTAWRQLWDRLLAGSAAAVACSSTDSIQDSKL
jgi:uncharacterized membrane protein HdeD (DUF308 family)